MRASNREYVLRYTGLKLCRRVCDAPVNTEKPRAQGDHIFTASDHKTPKLPGFLQDFWELRGHYGSCVVTSRSGGAVSGADAGIPVGARMQRRNTCLDQPLSAPRASRGTRVLKCHRLLYALSEHMPANPRMHRHSGGGCGIHRPRRTKLLDRQSCLSSLVNLRREPRAFLPKNQHALFG